MSGFLFGSLIIGRFSGIHIGHIALMQKAHKEHKDNILVIGIVVGSKTQHNKKKNPFSFSLRYMIIEKILNKLNINHIIISIPNAYIPDVYKHLLTLGIDTKYLYCGSDRTYGYTNQHIAELGITIVPIERGNNTSDVSMISASMMRSFILEDRYDAFIRGLNVFNILTEEEVYNIWKGLREEITNDSTH